MRSGACTLQQTLTSEAASVLKHSLGLARRRGHAQVTPLHVAATLLSLRASSLRRACLKSQQQHYQTSNSLSNHPLQCRALELCFNVALNRLPTTPPNGVSGGTLLNAPPSLSNALIAALKRAQAHQRRGCIEQQQQQPLLTIKVELEQLIISILDDPSVSRVMREAGFSSTAVKNNIEEDNNNNTSASTHPSLFLHHGGGVFSSPCSPSLSEKNHREISTTTSTFFKQNHFFGGGGGAYSSHSEYSIAPLLFSPQKKVAPVYPISTIESLVPHSFSSSSSSSKEDDVKVVLDVLLRKKKRNTVIVGDSLSLTEGLVGEIMGRLEKGEVPEELKSTHFIKFQLVPTTVSSLRFMKREEVEMSLSALKRKVDSIVSLGGGKGAILYVGDLKWIVMDDANLSEKKEGGEVVYSGGYYNPVDHMVAEIGKLFSEHQGNNNNTKVWLLATASYQTYMRCQTRQPPLENQWTLQAVPVPSGGLGLTLHASSVHDSKMSISQNPSHILESKLLSNKEETDKLNCCEECASNYEKEAQLFKPGQKKLLPSWLQSHSTEAHHKDELIQLKKKWNRLCHCLHQNKQPQNHWSNNPLYGNNNHTSNAAKIYPYNSSYPWWPNQQGSSNSIFPDSSNSITFSDSAMAKPAYSSTNTVPRFRRQQSCTTIEFNFNDVPTQKKQQPTTTLDDHSLNNKEVKITLALGNSTAFGGSGDETVLMVGGKNITDESKTLRRAHILKLLQENVPWQSETLASIAEALVVGSDSNSKSAKESATTWLFLQGNDSIGKNRLARAIAESVFGSADVYLHLDMLKMEENSETPFSEMLSGALKKHEKIVLLVENVDFADAQFKKSLSDGFENAKIGTLLSGKKEENSMQAIFILSNGGGTSRISEDHNKKDSVMRLVLQISETKPITTTLEENESSLISSPPCLGHNKRRAELDLFTNKIKKSPRIEEKEEGGKRGYSRQSSFNNTLDLNMKADEEEGIEGEEEEYNRTGSENSPISSDLTCLDPLNSNGSSSIEYSIENRFEFNQSASKDKEMAEMFLRRIKESFEEVCGKQCVGKFNVEERVIEEIGVGCGSFTNSMFEKWLKDIFQRSLKETVRCGGGGKKEGIVFTLCCWGGKEGDTKLDSSSSEGFMGSCLPKNIHVVNYFMD